MSPGVGTLELTAQEGDAGLYQCSVSMFGLDVVKIVGSYASVWLINFILLNACDLTFLING